MFKLILEHEYMKPKPAVDTSRFMQHGSVINASHSLDGISAGSGALRFFAPDSEVRVPTGPTWMNMRAIAVQVWLKLNALPGQRQNLIEGDNCFALFIDPGGAVVASFLGLVQGQNTVQWNSVSTATDSPSGVAVTLQPGVWSFISFVFDGLGRARIWIDDNLAAVRSDFASGVGSVESAGVVIGNWTLSNQYWLDGEIDSVRVWKEDPVAPIAQFYSRLGEESRRQAWDRFFDCLSRTNPDRLQQYAGLAVELHALLRMLIGRLYGLPEEQLKEFLTLLGAYHNAWRSNSIGSSEHITVVLALQRFMESVGGPEFAERLRQLVDFLAAISGDEVAHCLRSSGLGKVDLEFVSFVEQAAPQSGNY